MSEESDPWRLFNVAALDAPSSGFVGRRREILALANAFRNGTRVVLLTGEAGMGKTALGRVFADLAVGQFRKGIRFGHPGRIDLLDQLRKPALPTGGGERGLFVADQDGPWDGELRQAFRRFVQMDRTNDLLVTSREAVEIYPESQITVPLGPFSRMEAHEFLRRRLGEVPAAHADQLYEELSGHVLSTEVAATALQRKIIGWDFLFEGFRDFDRPGIVDPQGEPLPPGCAEEARIIVDVASTNRKILERLQSDPRAFWTLPPRRFEEVIAEILGRHGYEITLTPPTRDGGFDLYAASNGALGRFLFLVECKRYVPPNKVGVEIVRSLHGVVKQKGATAGVVVTTSFFSQAAEEFRQQVVHELTFHDYLALQGWLKSLK